MAKLSTLRTNIVNLPDLTALDIHRKIRVSRHTQKEPAKKRRAKQTQKQKALKALGKLSPEELKALIAEHKK